jgi:hypothetical protein
MARITLLLTCSLIAWSMQLGTTLSSSQASPATASPTVCAQQTATGLGGFNVPLRVKNSGHGVCIDSEGPFPFVVDTGAEQSTIAPAIARQLKLPSGGKNQQTGGVGAPQPQHRRESSIGRRAQSRSVLRSYYLSALTDSEVSESPLASSGLTCSAASEPFGSSSGRRNLTSPGPKAPGRARRPSSRVQRRSRHRMSW